MLLKNIIKSTSLIILPLVCSNAGAFGIGAYTTAINSGSAEWDRYYASNTGFDTDLDQKEFGFVLDSSIARNKLYNWRMQIGSVDASYDNLDFEGVIFINTFGFGVVRNENFRFWLGPQISLKSLEAKGNNNLDLVSFGLAYATGLNYHVNKVVSLTADAGLRTSFGVAETGDFFGDEFDIKEDRFFVNVGILFRFGDNY